MGRETLYRLPLTRPHHRVAKYSHSRQGGKSSSLRSPRHGIFVTAEPGAGKIGTIRARMMDPHFSRALGGLSMLTRPEVAGHCDRCGTPLHFGNACLLVEKNIERFDGQAATVEDSRDLL